MLLSAKRGGGIENGFSKCEASFVVCIRIAETPKTQTASSAPTTFGEVPAAQSAGLDLLVSRSTEAAFADQVRQFKLRVSS